MRETLWWAIVTIMGIVIEASIKGIGAFLPALILSLQRERRIETFFLGVLWIIIQNGISNLPFGIISLWYLSVILFFFWMKNYLASTSIIFVSIISLCSCICYLISIFAISALEEIIIPTHIIFQNALKQLFLFPIIWKLYHFLYYKYFLKEDNAIF